eukprot:2969959-Rhodomonas_salina.1
MTPYAGPVPSTAPSHVRNPPFRHDLYQRMYQRFVPRFAPEKCSYIYQSDIAVRREIAYQIAHLRSLPLVSYHLVGPCAASVPDTA